MGHGHTKFASRAVLWCNVPRTRFFRATAAGHPLRIHPTFFDIRLNACIHPPPGALHAVGVILRSEGLSALYKGLVPTLVGIAPYAALNFASYDIIKKTLYAGQRPQSAVANLAVGGAAGIIAGALLLTRAQRGAPWAPCSMFCAHRRAADRARGVLEGSTGLCYACTALLPHSCIARR